MKHEIEKKFHIFDEEKFLSTLNNYKITLGETIRQKDKIYLRAGKNFLDLHKGEPVIRIREEKNGFKTTLKLYKDGTLNRVEVECGITDDIAFSEYLECLGFFKIVTVDKTRREANFSGVKILFDNISNLGKFVEFEVVTDSENTSESLKKLEQVINELGFNDDNVVKIPYDEMIYNKESKK